MRKKFRNKFLAFVLAGALAVGSLYSIPTARAAEGDTDTVTYPWSPTTEATTGDYIADSYNGIEAGHVIENVTQERLLDILSSEGDYYIVFGSAKNESSQKVLPLINEQAKETGIKKIYYFDPILDGYQLDITKKNTPFKASQKKSVYELWERIVALLPDVTLSDDGKITAAEDEGVSAFDGYTSDDTLLFVYSNDRQKPTIKASFNYGASDIEAETNNSDDVIKEAIKSVFTLLTENGVTGDVRTDLEFFKRTYNASATYFNWFRSKGVATENYLAVTDEDVKNDPQAIKIFEDKDFEDGTFPLHQIGYTELMNILNSPGEHYIFLGASWCHNTQAIIGSVAREAQKKGEPVYVYDLTIGNQLEFGTGDDIDKVISYSGNFNARNSVVTQAVVDDPEAAYTADNLGDNNISYLYGELAKYFGDFITENNTKQNNSISYYPNGDLDSEATTITPWSEEDGEKNAIRLQMPFLLAYDKSKAEPVTRQWLHKDYNVNEDGTFDETSFSGTYTEYMLELAWVLATDEAKASEETNYSGIGLTKVQFAAEAVENLKYVFGDANELVSTKPTQPTPSGSDNTGTGQTTTTTTITNTNVSKTPTASPSPSPEGKVTKPKAPTIKKVKAGKKSATVTWKKVSGVKGYVIYRATSKKGKYKKVATVSAKKTSYKVKKLKKKKKYFFKIRSYKLDGKKKVYSSYSKVKSVKVK